MIQFRRHQIDAAFADRLASISRQLCFLPLGQFILFAVTEAFVLPHSAFSFKIMFMTCDPTVFYKVKHKLFKNYLTTKRYHIQVQLFYIRNRSRLITDSSCFFFSSVF